MRSALAGGGHADIVDYGPLFKALAATKGGAHPRSHTDTDPTSDGDGEQIWWLNGPRAADDYDDFYDGSWDHSNPTRTEAGNPKTFEMPNSADSDRVVWTGTRVDGTRSSTGHLGTTTVNSSGDRLAAVGAPQSGDVWRTANVNRELGLFGLYGLSDTLYIEPPDAPYATVAAVDSVPENGTDLQTGEFIDVTVTFSEEVEVSGANRPRLPLQIGDNVRYAIYSDDSSATELTFSYMVTEDDQDTDGFTIDAFSLDLNGATITGNTGDHAGVAAVLTHTGVVADESLKVNLPPLITAVKVTSTPQATSANDTYGLGEDIEITVTFSEAVDVTGDVEFGLDVDGPRQARLSSGDGTTELVFVYTVQAGGEDDDGIWIGNHDSSHPTFDLQPGQFVTGADSGQAAVLEHDEVGLQADHQVNDLLTGADATLSALTLSGITLDQTFTAGAAGTATTSFTATTTASTTTVAATASQSGGSSAVVIDPADDDTTTAGHQVSLEEDADTVITVTVTSTNGDSTRAYTITVTRQAAADIEVSWAAASYAALEGHPGTTVTLVLSAVPTDDVTVPISTVLGGGASVDDYSGVPTSVTFDSASVVVDGLPTESFTVVATDDDFHDGDDNDETLTLSFGTLTGVEAGTPSSTTVALVDNEIPNTSGLIPAGISVGEGFRLLFVTSNKRNPESSDIAEYDSHIQTDITGNGSDDIKKYVELFRVLGSTADVDARDHTDTTYTPMDLGVPIWWVEGPKAADDYEDFYDGGWDARNPGREADGDEFTFSDVAVDLDSWVWTGTSSDGTNSSGSFMSGSSGLGRPEVGVGRPGFEGEELFGTNTTDTDFAARLYGLSFVLRAAAPAGTPYVTDVAVDRGPDGGDYETGDTITVGVTFSEPVSLSGTGEPTFPLDIGKDTRNAAYQSISSDGTVLTFSYEVTAGDIDHDGISITALTFDLPTGASITNGSSVDAYLGPIALSTEFGVNVPPFITGVVTSTPKATSAGDTYGQGEDIEITVTFSEAVNVEGDIDFGLSVSGAKRARLKSGSNTTELVFVYTVQAGDADTNGIFIGNHDSANATFDLQPSGQSIVGVAAPGRDARLEHDEVGTLGNRKVDGTLTGADATLSALSLSGITLDQTFTAGAAGTATTSFTATATATVSTTTVTATASRSGGSSAVVITPVDADTTTAGHQVNLAADADTVITVTVTSTNGDSTRTYTITVTRQAATDSNAPAVDSATVSSDGTTVDIVFDEDLDTTGTAPAVTAFDVTVDGGTAVNPDSVAFHATDADTITLTMATADTIAAGAAVSVAYDKPASNPLKDAADNEVASFTGNDAIAVLNRPAAASSDADLSALTVDGTSVEDFDKDDTDYSLSVAGTVARVTLEATTSDDGASVAYSVADADSGTAGHQVDLDGGSNEVVITVTAEDTTTTEDYTVTVHRAAVPHDWSLRPDGVPIGGMFRLLFVTSTTRNGRSGDIGPYDTHVRSALAGTGAHADIRDYSAQFKALAGTKDGPDPSTHTGTDPVADGIGVPIWWLDGPLAAADNDDFYEYDRAGSDFCSRFGGDACYDGWAHSNPARVESGDEKTFEAGDENESDVTEFTDWYVWTGTDSNGARESDAHLGSGGGGLEASAYGQPFDNESVWSLAVGSSPSDFSLPHALDGNEVLLGLYGLSDTLYIEAPDAPYATVAAVTSTPANGTDYRAGETVTATVTFSEAVEVDTASGTPSLELDIGSDTGDALYQSSSTDGTVLSFSYPVVADDEDLDGIAVAMGALKLNGGAITGTTGDHNSVDAVLTHAALPADENQQVNSQQSSAQVSADGNIIHIVFDEDLDTNRTAPAPGAFSVTVDGGTAVSPRSVAFHSTSANTIVLTMEDTIATGATVTVTYTEPTENALVDSSSNNVATFTSAAVSADTTAPSPASARVSSDGTTIDIVFDEDLDTTGSVPATTAFTVTVGTATGVNPDSVAFHSSDAAAVTLTMASTAAGAAVTVDYDGPTSNALADAASNKVADFIDLTALNRPAAPDSLSLDPGEHQIVASWTAPSLDGGSAITGYRVEWTIGTQQTWEQAETAGQFAEPTTSPHIISGPAVSAYRVRVRAVNDAGPGPPIMAASTTLPPPVISSARVDISDHSRIVTQFLDGPDLAYLDALSKPDKSAFTVTDVTDGMPGMVLGVSSVEFADIQPGSNVDDRLATVFVVIMDTEIVPGNSLVLAYEPPSTDPLQGEFGHNVLAITGQTVLNLPAAPTVTLTAGVAQITASWDEPADGGSAIDGYRVEWKTDSQTWAEAETAEQFAEPGVSPYTITGATDSVVSLTNDTEYTVRVYAVNDVGDSPPSIEVSAAPADTTAPSPSSAQVSSDGTTIDIVFDEDLDTDEPLPLNTQFTVAVDGDTGVNPTGVAFHTSDADTITLTMASADTIAAGATVTVSYRSPGTPLDEADLADTTGNKAASFTAQPALNRPAAPASLLLAYEKTSSGYEARISWDPVTGFGGGTTQEYEWSLDRVDSDPSTRISGGTVPTAASPIAVDLSSPEAGYVYELTVTAQNEAAASTPATKQAIFVLGEGGQPTNFTTLGLTKDGLSYLLGNALRNGQRLMDASATLSSYQLRHKLIGDADIEASWTTVPDLSPELGLIGDLDDESGYHLQARSVISWMGDSYFGEWTDSKTVDNPWIVENGVAVTSTPQFASDPQGQADTYGLGETIEVRVTYNEPVRVVGSPTLSICLSSAATQCTMGAEPEKRSAAYDSEASSDVPGGKTAVFRYVVQAGDTAPDGIWVRGIAASSANDIVSVDNGASSYNLNDSLPSQPGHKVDGSLAADIEVSWASSSYTALEGHPGTTVTVMLSAEPADDVTVPVSAAVGGGASVDDYSGVPASVTFDSASVLDDDGRPTESFVVVATDDDFHDGNDNDETLTLSFGTLPSGVSAGTPDATTVALVDNEVPATSALIPDGVAIGEGFRLLFVTSNKRNAESTDIADYNWHVQSRAESRHGHDDIQPYSSQFQALASTTSIDARDNTATNRTEDGTGVPIWWFNGPRVADDNRDFWDGTRTSGGWDNQDPGRDEDGDEVDFDGDDTSVYTGTYYDGTTEFPVGSNINPLGVAPTVFAKPGESAGEVYFGGGGLGSSRHLYGLSYVLYAAAPADTPYVTDVETVDPPDVPYRSGDTIEVKVIFSESVTVTGAPTFPMEIGRDTRQAVYQATESTGTELVFTHLVTDDDYDNSGSGISNAKIELDLPAGTSITRAGASTVAAYPGSIVWKPDLKVNPNPRLTNIEITSDPRSGSDSDTYGSREVIEFTATFDVPVTVTGDATEGNVTLKFFIGEGLWDQNERYADLSTSDGTEQTEQLVFTYTVNSLDVPRDGGVVFINPSNDVDSHPPFELEGDQSIQGRLDRGAKLDTIKNKRTYPGHMVHGRMTPPPVADTSPPENLRAFAGKARIDLEWDEPSAGAPANGYRVRWRKSSESGFAASDTAAVATGTEYSVSGLSDGEAHVVQVASLDASSDPGDWVEAQATVGRPKAVGDLTVATRRLDFRVSWDAPDERGEGFEQDSDGDPVLVYRVSWAEEDQDPPADPDPVQYQKRCQTGTATFDFYEYYNVQQSVNSINFNLRPPADGDAYSFTVEARFETDPADDANCHIQTGYGASSEATATATDTAADVTADDHAGALAALESVVDTHEAQQPWLRTALTHTSTAPGTVEAADLPRGTRGEVSFVGEFTTSEMELGYATANMLRLDIDWDLQSPAVLTYTAVHELAHVWTLDSTLHGTASRQEVGKALLYFFTQDYDGTEPEQAQCAVETLADAIAHVAVSPAALSYYGVDVCFEDDRPDPSSDDEELALHAMHPSGTTPGGTTGDAASDWLDTTMYTGDDASADAWADVEAITSTGYRALVMNLLQDSFGGYCSIGVANKAAFDGVADFPDSDVTDPWQDGGCEPQAPTDVTVSAVSGGSVDVSWTAPKKGGAPITRYTVQWRTAAQAWTDGIVTSTQSTDVDATATSHTITGLNSSQQYTARVRAINSIGDSEWSLETTAGTARALPPKNVRAAADSGAVTLSWDAPDDGTVTGYRIERRPAAAGPQSSNRGLGDDDVLVGDTGSAVTVYVDDTVEPGVDYQYRVAAIGPDGTGQPSRWTRAEPDAAVEANPNNPATGSPTIRGTAQVGQTLTANITGISDSDGVDLASFAYQWVSSDGTTDTDIEDATGSTYELVDADQGRSVKVRLTFTDGGGNEETLTSAPTEPVLGDGPPGAPRNLTATAGDREVSLSWEPPADNGNAPVTRYRIEWRIDGKDYSSSQWGTSRGATYTTTDGANLANGVKYVFRVTAENGSGNSHGPYGPASEEVSATPTSGSAVDLGTPVLSDTEVLHRGMVRLDWQDIEGAGWYVVQYYHLKGAEWLDLPAAGVDVALHGSSAVVSGVDGLSWLRVRAMSCAGGSEWSQIEPLFLGNASQWDAVPVPEVADGDETEPCPVVLGTPVLSDTEVLHEAMVRLDWQDIEGAGWYVVQYYHLKGAEWLDLPAVGVDVAYSGSSAVVSGVDTLSWLRVRAMSCAGESEWSQIEQLLLGNASQWEGVPVPEVADGDEIEPCPEDVDTPDNSPATEKTLTSPAAGAADAQPDNSPAAGAADAQPDNSPATGAPTIDGTVQVGETLTADTSGVVDADGLSNVQYEYQWLADDSEIAGATGSTYTLVAADEGRAIKVQVSFTDDADNEETLTSAATGTVVGAQPAEPPGKPSGLFATASHDSVTLTWDDPGDDSITGYVILRRIPGVDPEGHFDELVADTGTSATTYTDDTVSVETRYTYRIKAINGAGVSERSRWFHINTPAAQ